MLESTLQKKCNEYLKLLDIQYIHLEKGRYNKGHQHRAGVPDLIIFKDSRTIFIELKTEKGTLSNIQLEYIRKLMTEGFAVYTCRSLEEFKLVLKTELGASC